MRTPEQCAVYMIERYGKAAAWHASHAVINNWEHPEVRSYWQQVRDHINHKNRSNGQ